MALKLKVVKKLVFLVPVMFLTLTGCNLTLTVDMIEIVNRIESDIKSWKASQVNAEYATFTEAEFYEYKYNKTTGNGLATSNIWFNQYTLGSGSNLDANYSVHIYNSEQGTSQITSFSSKQNVSKQVVKNGENQIVSSIEITFDQFKTFYIQKMDLIDLTLIDALKSKYSVGQKILEGTSKTSYEFIGDVDVTVNMLNYNKVTIQNDNQDRYVLLDGEDDNYTYRLKVKVRR